MTAYADTIARPVKVLTEQEQRLILKVSVVLVRTEELE